MFYLSNILERKIDKAEKIIELLIARGFLIDSINERYYLSDNAAIEDVQFLQKKLFDYSLGTLIDPKDYAISSRRNWYDLFDSRSFRYNVIKPQTIEVLISKDAKVEDAVRIFTDSSQIGYESAVSTRKWCQFAKELLGEKTSVFCLESYVAYYVKAASSCGVYTNFSCDGNHEQGNRLYVYADYPSSVWHELLWKYIVCREFGNIPFIGDGLYFSDEISQKQVYEQVYEIADYLYANRIAIRGIKEQSVKCLTKNYLKRHSEKEVEGFYRQGCEKILLKDSVVLIQNRRGK